MSDQTNKGFTFFLGSSPKEIAEKDNPSLEYIVIQNDFLHKKVKELEKQIEELTREKDEFEEDNERYEKRMLALRGITFNECEMSNLIEQTVEGYKLVIAKHKDIHKHYKSALKSDYIIIMGFYILNYIFEVFGFIFPWLFFYTLGLFLIAINAYLSNEIDKISDKITLDPMYVKKEEQYKELRKNQDYVSTMIENM